MDKPEGFSYFPTFITPAKEAELLMHMGELNWQTIQMHGVTAKRRVVHYGYDYLYTTRQAVPTEPAPAYLKSIVAEAGSLLKIDAADLEEILITEYPVGAPIGWHVDSTFFGDKVFGVSLENSCIFKLRKKTDDGYIIYKQELAPCSAYILTGPARYEWEHSILPVKARRYSITLRTLTNKPIK